MNEDAIYMNTVEFKRRGDHVVAFEAQRGRVLGVFHHRLLLAAALGCLFGIVSSSLAGDWPQFRGPGSTGVAVDAVIPTAPKIDWHVDLPGRGLASPIVVGEKVFVTCSSGPKQERLHVICLNFADGKKLWERQLRATGRTMSHSKTAVAACTPCSDGTRIFALWSSNDLAAFDLEGNLLWLRGLTADYPNVSNSLGMASSPIVVGETVVTVIENDSESYTVGIDVRTGKNLWKLDRPKAANWTSPLPWSAGADAPRVALLQSTKGLTAVDAASGSRLWDYAEGASSASSGIVASGVVYVVSNGVTALVPGNSDAAPTQLWRSKQINPVTISPVILGDRVFGTNGAGVLTAVEAKTGNVVWKLRMTGPFSGSPVGAGTTLLGVNEKGLVQIVDTTAPEGKVVGELQLPLKPDSKELILCTPALSGEHVFIRTDSTLWRLGK
jgi:outer membrane protein assembly factor BamB